MIYKYALPDGNDQNIEMPSGARIISVHAQNDNVCLWAEVDPAKPMRARRIRAVPTGGNVPEFGIFLGTCLLCSGSFVLHIYEVVA